MNNKFEYHKEPFLPEDISAYAHASALILLTGFWFFGMFIGFCLHKM